MGKQEVRRPPAQCYIRSMYPSLITNRDLFCFKIQAFNAPGSCTGYVTQHLTLATNHSAAPPPAFSPASSSPRLEAQLLTVSKKHLLQLQTRVFTPLAFELQPQHRLGLWSVHT